MLLRQIVILMMKSGNFGCITATECYLICVIATECYLLRNTRDQNKSRSVAVGRKLFVTDSINQP
jgi:hypothetical protein